MKIIRYLALSLLMVSSVRSSDGTSAEELEALKALMIINAHHNRTLDEAAHAEQNPHMRALFQAAQEQAEEAQAFDQALALTHPGLLTLSASEKEALAHRAVAATRAARASDAAERNRILEEGEQTVNAVLEKAAEQDLLRRLVEFEQKHPVPMRQRFAQGDALGALQHNAASSKRNRHLAIGATAVVTTLAAGASTIMGTAFANREKSDYEIAAMNPATRYMTRAGLRIAKRFGLSWGREVKLIAPAAPVTAGDVAIDLNLDAQHSE